MPRNGDGSSDNGPIEGHEIVHGTDGDKTLQHTKHVAPMPSQEQGDALPGLGAGGVAAPIPDNAEEYGTNEPRKDPVTGETIDEDQSSGNNNSSSNTRNVTSPEPARPSNKRQKTADVDVSQGKDTTSSNTGGSGAGASSGTHGHASGDSERHDLDQVMREKAEKYVNLDEDEVNMASASTEEGKREARAERRADALGQSEHGVGQDEARRHGGHADVEELHGGVGKTSSSSASSGGAKGGSEGSAGHKQHDGGAGGEGNELEQVQRRQAEKFGVNLQDE